MRISELDSLRGLAALGIVLWHYSSHFHAQPLAAFLTPFYNAGFYLVDFFFVLSGFVLGMAYSRSKCQDGIAKSMINRVARLYPLHLVTLVLVWFGQTYLMGLGEEQFVYQYNDGWHFVLNLFLAQSIGMQEGFSFNGPAWAISVLFMVNVLFFLVSCKTKRSLVICAMLMLLSLLGLFFYQRRITANGNVLGFLDSKLLRSSFGFFMGVVFYNITQKFDQGLSRFKQVADAIWVIFFAVMIVFFLENTRKRCGFDFLMVLVVFPMLIYWASNGQVVSWFLNRGALYYLGRISYSVYLVHFPLQLLIHIAVVSGWIKIEYGSAVTLAMFVAILFGLSMIAYHLVESPGRKFIQAVALGWYVKLRQ